MFSFNKRANATSVKPTRISSPVTYGGTPWTTRALSMGNGIGSVRSLSPPSMSKLNLPIANIIDYNDKLVNIMVEAVKSTQDLKNHLASVYTSEELFTTVMDPVFVPNPALNSAQQMIEIIEKQ